MIITFKDHHQWLGSRQGGKNAKKTLRAVIENASAECPVVFDFAGVHSISSSFADEFFGKLIAEMGFDQFKAVTTFKNVSPFVISIIKNSIFHRNENVFVKS